MRRYMVRRLLLTILVLFVSSLAVFYLIHAIPGDPVDLLAGPGATEEAKAQARKRLALDRPLYVQYGTFVVNALRGDLGRSFISREPVAKVILSRLPHTLQLGIASLVLAYLVAVPLGVISAVKRGTFVDQACMAFALLGVATPSFWLALVLMLVFAVKLKLLPLFGYGTVKHLVLPAVALAAYATGLSARVTRSAVLDVLPKDFVRTARAKGLGERVVLYRHVLRNALIPVVSLFGLEAGWLVGGSVVIESVFARPGIGRLLVDSIFWRDYSVVQGILLLLTATVALCNLLADICYTLLDPRIRLE